MKIIYKKFNVLLLVFFMSGAISCESFLTEDPKGRLATETFFNKKSDLDASLNALYYIIATSNYANHHTGTNFTVGSDIATHPASNKQPLREHDQFDVSSNNS